MFFSRPTDRNLLETTVFSLSLSLFALFNIYGGTQFSSSWPTSVFILFLSLCWCLFSRKLFLLSIEELLNFIFIHRTDSRFFVSSTSKLSLFIRCNELDLSHDNTFIVILIIWRMGCVVIILITISGLVSAIHSFISFNKLIMSS